jgi:NAD(P)-dependent dehydrogenase (short-subunit alcohol dehydrogenase family)
VELADRHIVVTGAASGIGRAMVERFAEERPKAIVCADLHSDALHAAAESVDGLAVPTDVSRPDQIHDLVAAAREANGPIDLFVSNAGIAGPLGGPEAPDEEIQRTWEINVMAHIWAARELIPEMVERGEGYLLSTASAAGVLSQVSAIAYSATKHAAVAVAEWISINYADSGITVSCLCPQGVRTPMLEEATGDDTAGAAALRAAGVIEPSEVADAVVETIREERFFVLPHPEVADFMALKGGNPERWLAGMRKIVRNNGGPTTYRPTD